MLEAQAAALPVIATHHAGIPDVVLDNETGLLSEERDVNGMAENMMRVLKEENLARDLGETGRESIEDHFTMQRHLGKLEEVILNSYKR